MDEYAKGYRQAVADCLNILKPPSMNETMNGREAQAEMVARLAMWAIQCGTSSDDAEISWDDVRTMQSGEE